MNERTKRINEGTNENDDGDDGDAVDDGHTYTKYIRKRKMVYNKWRQHNIYFAARACTLLFAVPRLCCTVLFWSVSFRFFFFFSARARAREFFIFLLFRSSSYSSSYSSSSFFASFVILMFHFNFIHRSSHCAQCSIHGSLEFLDSCSMLVFFSSIKFLVWVCVCVCLSLFRSLASDMAHLFSQTMFNAESTSHQCKCAIYR